MTTTALDMMIIYISAFIYCIFLIAAITMLLKWLNKAGNKNIRLASHLVTVLFCGYWLFAVVSFCQSDDPKKYTINLFAMGFFFVASLTIYTFVCLTLYFIQRKFF